MDSAASSALFVNVTGGVFVLVMAGYCIFVGVRDLKRGTAVLKLSKDKPMSGGAAKAFNICLIILGVSLITLGVGVTLGIIK